MYKDTPTRRNNFATADRPRCMLRNDYYYDPHYQPQQPQQQQRRYRKFDYYRENELDENNWYWNMNQQEPLSYCNGSSISAKSSHQGKSDRSSSGFQSFFRWFKRSDDKSQRNSKDIRYPRDLTSSTDTLEFDHDRRVQPRQYRKKLKAYQSTDTTPPASPRLSYAQSSSCDSVFSTASSFAFVPPIKYLLNRNQKQIDRSIFDNPYTESYHKRVKARDRMRELDRKNEITLRKKYHLYEESSDLESNNNNNNCFTPNNNTKLSALKNHKKYQDLSLPNSKKIPQEPNNLSDTAKLQDLNIVAKVHRRTSSDTSKDKRAGAFVHVKHKRKAPPPPLDFHAKSLTPRSTTGRKKRPAPQPPISPTTRVLEATSATSLLGDKEIQAIIHGTSTSLFKNSTTLSTPTVAATKESPKMEEKRYVSPYLKIREDRKLTDEQKRILLEQVSKKHRKSEEPPQPNTNTNTNTFSIEKGQLVYSVGQRAESPKITKDDKEKIFAPSSPISPRPWYKRASNSGNNHKETIPFKKEVFLKTMEKRKKKDEKDLPEVGYSRNSFFESASKFNIFARLSDDSKKKERDAEKRRSQIGIPNISELDREAAEIIQREQEASKAARKDEEGSVEREEPINAKELINKFEANSSNINRISINSGFIGRDDLFGKCKPVEKEKNKLTECERNKSVEIEKNKPIESETKDDKKEKSPIRSKLPVSLNGSRKTNNSLMGLWTCPYCTLQNPNWKIICEACEKIKPYEKRYCATNGDVKKESPIPVRKFSFDNVKNENPWEKKTEIVKKYFQTPLNKPGDLAKSSSETFIGNSLLKKSPSPTRRYMGSPKMLPRKLSIEKQEGKIDSIAEESNDDKNEDEKVIIRNTKLFYPQINGNDIRQSTPDKLNSKKLTPDLNEIRSARLARFNTSLDMKKNQSEVEKLNVTSNRKQSPEKKFPSKLDFSDPVALEKEKERLREKIRAMNAKALADKYPVLKPLNEPKEEDEENAEEITPSPSAPLISPANTPESSKLGAIKKILKKPLDVRNEGLEDQAIAIEEKIINKESKSPEPPKEKEKREKISTSVQTSAEIKLRKKSVELPILPTTVVEFTKKGDKIILIKEKSDTDEKLKLEEKDQIKPMVNANTLAINKILRNLENAIADGKHDEAARFAKDLARMKVPLSVTRQKDRPKSEVNEELQKVKAWLCIKENFREMEVNCYEISSQMTIDELKNQISKDYYVPVQKQKIYINGIECNNDSKPLNELGINLDENLKINVDVLNGTKTEINGKKEESDSDDEPQNEKVGGSFDGAVGGIKIDKKNENTKLKIEESGWECPLCTLINLTTRQQCLACSTLRPTADKLLKLKELEYHLKVNDDLRTFFEMDKVDLRSKNIVVERNDLNRQSANRKSSEIFNILVEDKNSTKKEVVPQQNAIIMTAAISSPNITKNKYRGVDNFNPFNKSYVFPKVEAASKPIITNVIYKSSHNVTKELLPLKKTHYQELVHLEISDTVPNSDKFECSICFLEIEPKSGVCLRDCLHSFCKLCLESHIKYSEEAEIKCPFINDMYSCQSFLQEREVRGLVSKEEYERHLSRSIRLAENKIENAFHCKTPNCKGWCIYEDTTNSFKCPVCTILNCITCGAIHDGLNCKQYQDHLNKDSDIESANETKKLLQDLLDKEEAMTCPRCHIFLLKKWGCDWLKCSFCKTEICWVTKGLRWGPSGKGDISAGCRCGVNNKKCSPKCTYCH